MPMIFSTLVSPCQRRRDLHDWYHLGVGPEDTQPPSALSWLQDMYVCNSSSMWWYVTGAGSAPGLGSPGASWNCDRASKFQCNCSVREGVGRENRIESTFWPPVPANSNFAGPISPANKLTFWPWLLYMFLSRFWSPFSFSFVWLINIYSQGWRDSWDLVPALKKAMVLIM